MMEIYDNDISHGKSILQNTSLIISSQVDSPLITIGIPTYKRAETLKEAISSALNQDVKTEYEILICDNNPERNDETERLMSNYKDLHNISYYKNRENIGGLGNWNRIYDLAKGRYVVLLHDDDLLYPYYLNVILRVIKYTNNKYSLIYPKSNMSHDRILEKREIPKEIICQILYPQDYVVNIYGLVSGMCFDKDAFKVVGGFKPSFDPVSDQEFLFRSLHYIKAVRIANLPLIKYCVGSGNDSTNPLTIKNAIIQSDKFYRTFRREMCWPWRWYTYLCYRFQIKGLLSYWSNFGSEDIIRETKETIGYYESQTKDTLSCKIAELIRKYIWNVRTFRIRINE